MQNGKIDPKTGKTDPKTGKLIPTRKHGTDQGWSVKYIMLLL